MSTRCSLLLTAARRGVPGRFAHCNEIASKCLHHTLNLFIPGVALAGLVVTAYGLIRADWLLRRKAGWLHIAVRVAGSWIAAIGILLVLGVSGRTLLAA